jgi:hypothetical protein
MDPARPQPAPDELPRSLSGRVPQWVVDEANGRQALPTGWRAAAESGLPSRAPNRRRWPRVLIGATVSAFVALAIILQLPSSGNEPMDTAGSDAPPPGLEEASTPLGTPPPAPPGPTGAVRAQEFLNTSKQGVPVTFSPCRPLHYVVRPDNAPRDGEAMLASAVKRLSAATGLTVINDGATDEPATLERDPYQPERYGNRWAPVLVAWATEEEVPDFGADTVGRAGPIQFTLGDGTTGYVSGVVLLDPEAIAEIRASDGRAPARAIILHELGHLVGLDHTTRDDQLMYPNNLSEETDYAAGDLAGLARLGAGPCQPGL